MELTPLKSSRFVIALLFVLPLFLASDCSTDSTPEEGPVPFEILMASNTRYVDEEPQDILSCVYKNIEFGSFTVSDSSWENGVLRSKSILIDNQEIFDNYISCTDSISIDMSSDIFLAGVASTPGCHVLWNQDVKLGNDSLHYNVEIMNQDCAKPEGSGFMVRVPRKYHDYPVNFNVHWWQEE